VKHPKLKGLQKSPTGIQGFDEITFGGVPRGRATLICGGAGCGKTLFAMEFIVKGATLYNEPGVFVSFEEISEELIQNVLSLGFDLKSLIKKNLVSVDYIHIEKSEIEETGEFNLDGLFIRLEYIINSINAKRIVLDTVESLFAGISNHAVLRAELRRLFRWLKGKGVTAIITGERGEKTLTREGLEEYVSDCVIFLDNRVMEQYSTRRMRIIKYRGSYHGMNEYPFLINENGISVLPLSSLKLQHEVSHERVTTGVKGLDEMFGGKGYYRGSTVLVSGTAGVGKTSVAAHFVESNCKRGEKCIYIALEESKDQIIRNMNSIGINLLQWEDKGLLKFHVVRPTYYSLEMHLAFIHKLVTETNPKTAVIDPISNLTTISSPNEVNSLLTRLIDFLKMKKITALFTNLIPGGSPLDRTEIAVSSLVDTWISLTDIENGGERNRLLYIIKSRGIAHSNQVREFLLTPGGIKLVDVYVSQDGLLVGSARKAQEVIEKQMMNEREEENKLLNMNIERIEKIERAKIEALKAEYRAQILEMKRSLKESQIKKDKTLSAYKLSARSRQKLSKNETKTTGGDSNGKDSE